MASHWPGGCKKGLGGCTPFTLLDQHCNDWWCQQSLMFEVGVASRQKSYVSCELCSTRLKTIAVRLCPTSDPPPPPPQSTSSSRASFITFAINTFRNDSNNQYLMIKGMTCWPKNFSPKVFSQTMLPKSVDPKFVNPKLFWLLHQGWFCEILCLEI